MFDVLIKRLAKDNNIVYICSRKCAISSQHIINLLLYIRRRIFKFYDNYIELFLIAI